MEQQQAVEEASAAAGECGQPGEAVGQGGSPAAEASRAAAKAASTADAGKQNGAAAPGSAVSAVTNAGEQNAARAPGSGAATAAKSFAPAQTATYLSPQYWDERFAVEDSYEWCKDYSEFRHVVAPHIKPCDAILELGCGNSGMGAALAADGFSRITCTDLSATVVGKMRAKAAAAGLPVTYQVADMLDLAFEDGSFDVVIEKGAIEVFFTDSSSAWDPPAEVRQRVTKALGEAHRVLSLGGVFISVSFGQPHFRTPLFLADPAHTWACDVTRFGEAFDYYVYVLRKGRRKASAAAAISEASAAAPAAVRLGPVVRSRGEHEAGPSHDHMDEEGYLMQMDL